MVSPFVKASVGTTCRVDNKELISHNARADLKQMALAQRSDEQGYSV